MKTCFIDSDHSRRDGGALIKLTIEDGTQFVGSLTDDTIDRITEWYGTDARKVVIAAVRDLLSGAHPWVMVDEGIVARYHPQNDWARQALNGALAAVHGVAS